MIIRGTTRIDKPTSLAGCDSPYPLKHLTRVTYCPSSIYDMYVISCVPAYFPAAAMPWSSGNLLRSVPVPGFHKRRSQSVTPYSCRLLLGRSLFHCLFLNELYPSTKFLKSQENSCKKNYSSDLFNGKIILFNLRHFLRFILSHYSFADSSAQIFTMLFYYGGRYPQVMGNKQRIGICTLKKYLR